MPALIVLWQEALDSLSVVFNSRFFVLPKLTSVVGVLCMLRLYMPLKFIQLQGFIGQHLEA